MNDRLWQEHFSHLWVPLTIRIAWELSINGVLRSSELLAGAREHVFCSLPDSCSEMEAEWLAILYTKEFIDRISGTSKTSMTIDQDLQEDIPLPYWQVQNFWRDEDSPQ